MSATVQDALSTAREVAGMNAAQMLAVIAGLGLCAVVWLYRSHAQCQAARLEDMRTLSERQHAAVTSMAETLGAHLGELRSAVAELTAVTTGLQNAVQVLLAESQRRGTR